MERAEDQECPDHQNIGEDEDQPDQRSNGEDQDHEVAEDREHPSQRNSSEGQDKSRHKSDQRNIEEWDVLQLDRNQTFVLKDPDAIEHSWVVNKHSTDPSMVVVKIELFCGSTPEVIEHESDAVSAKVRITTTPFKQPMSFLDESCQKPPLDREVTWEHLFKYKQEDSSLHYTFERYSEECDDESGHGSRDRCFFLFFKAPGGLPNQCKEDSKAPLAMPPAPTASPRALERTLTASPAAVVMPAAPGAVPASVAPSVSTVTMASSTPSQR